MKKIILCKVIILLISLFVMIPNVNAETTYENLRIPKQKFYRFGTTNEPEIKNNTINRNNKNLTNSATINKTTKKTSTPKEYNKNITYADLTIKKMSEEIGKSLDYEYDSMQKDLSLLWQGAATRSETITFAIYKLSNPDKDKPDENAIKKLLNAMAGMSTLVGAGTGNPILSSAALIGGNTLGIMSQDNKALNYKYSKVNDIDMIILVRKIDELQQKIVEIYYDYMKARKRYNTVSNYVIQYKSNYEHVQDMSKEVIIISDAYYREAVDEQNKARGLFFEKRSKLEQLVGSEILIEFEKNLSDS